MLDITLQAGELRRRDAELPAYLDRPDLPLVDETIDGLDTDGECIRDLCRGQEPRHVCASILPLQSLYHNIQLFVKAYLSEFNGQKIRCIRAEMCYF